MGIISKSFDIIESFNEKPWKLRKPVVVQFPVNDICDAKCQMCNIWQQHFDTQVTLDEVDKIFSNPLFSEVRGIGLNGGEPTLRPDLPDIADILYQKLPKLRHISLITNGTKADRVAERVDRLAAVVKKHVGYLDVMVSLDGVGEVHDRVRGRPGNFSNAIKVLEHVCQHEGVDSTRIGCTVIRENVYGIHDLYDFARERDIYIKYRLGVPHQRLYTAPAESRQIGKRTWIFTRPYDLDFKARVHFSEFLWGLIKHYEPSWQQRYFYQSLIGQLIENAPRTAGCDWQHRGVTVSARGELLYCAVQSPVLGDARVEDAEKLYFENKPKLEEIIKNNCAQCAHDYVGLPAGNVLLRETFNEVLGKFGLEAADIKRLPGLKTWLKRRARQRFLKREKSVLSNVVNRSESSSKNTLTILVCGWYGTETLGDKAILGGVMASIRSVFPDSKLLLASLNLYVSRSTCEQMPELAPVEIVDVQQAAKRMGEVALLVFGGGPLMAIDEMADMDALFSIAKGLGVPSVIAGCGVGPLGDAYKNAAIKHLLQSASYRIYRDDSSSKAAQTLGVISSGRDFVAEDPAFEWVKINADKCHVTRTNRPTLLLGLRDWPYREYAAHLSQPEALDIKHRFEAAVILALELVVEREPSLVILPLPMCTNHFGDDDRFFYRKLLTSTPIKKALDRRFLAEELAPIKYLEAFLEAHVALTMRFHASVFSIACGLPTVALDYTLGQGKVASVAQRFNVPCLDLRDVDANRLADLLHRQMSQSVVDRPALEFSSVFSAILAKEFGRQAVSS